MSSSENNNKAIVRNGRNLQAWRLLKYENPIVMLISKIDECVTQSATVGEKLSKNMIITKILMSLSHKYKHFVSAWESMPEDKQYAGADRPVASRRGAEWQWC